MFLKKLEIQGFKSFADKTILKFEKGTTCIVGPNGSGKTNITEAIRWVLGEQSIKSLRGKKSQDIIFAGSDKRSSQGFASVSLFFDNSEKIFPLDFSEIVLCRRLFRDGESEYLINQNKVRLFDVNLYLLQAGFGQKTYTVIAQGMVDNFLLVSSRERKELLDEACGVKGFLLKKEEASKKLERTRENLEKTENLLEEIKPRLNFLERQKKKIEKRKEYQEKLFSLEKLWYKNLLEKIEEDLSMVVSRSKETEKDLSKKKEKIAELKKIKEEKEEKNKKIYQDFSEKQSFLERNLEEKMNLREKLFSLTKEDLVDLKNRYKEISSKIEKEREEEDKIEKEIGTREEELERKLAQYKKIEIPEIKDSLKRIHQYIVETQGVVSLEILREKIKEIEKEMAGLISEIEKRGEIKEKFDQNRLVSEINELKIKKAQISTRKQTLEEQIKELESRIRDSEQKTRNDQVKILGERINQKEREIKKLKEEISGTNENYQKIQKEIREIEKNLDCQEREIEKTDKEERDLEIEKTKIETRKQSLREEMGEEIFQAINNQKVPSLASEISQEEIKEKISRLRRKLELIGGIDSEIEKEYQETKKRFDFLFQESEDLKKAFGDLEKLISELEKKIKDQFEDAFKKINQGFDKYFKILFKGGRAKLEIIREERADQEKEDSHSPIFGIEIKASPPGKRLKEISMLSGGEKAFTSIALLFAIIGFRPSPFIVLDEVDAALDEANSQRFAKIIEELSSKTQFILITHNRETMKRARVLYGVTMKDDGVSKLVSLKLE